MLTIVTLVTKNNDSNIDFGRNGTSLPNIQADEKVLALPLPVHNICIAKHPRNCLPVNLHQLSDSFP